MQAVLTVCGHLPDTAFAPAEALIREGEATGAILVLVSGTVAVLRGDVRVARIRSGGAIFGEMSILLGMPASATVVAETPVLAKVVSDGAAFLGSSPTMALHTARILAQRLHDSTTYLADMKTQFQDKTDHFGMVDRIIGALLNQQADSPAATPRRTDDPRL